MELYHRATRLWQSWQIRTAADLDKYLHSFRILFAYHSGRIENEEITYQDTREIFEDGRITGFSGNPLALFEQQNQKLCYQALKEKFATREPLSPELVKEIHLLLTAGTYDERRYIINEERPGSFKKHDYVVGLHEVGSAASDVASELKELLDEVNAIGAKDPMRSAAYLHARFEYIHPFADGNGRVGRTLVNYWLMLNNHPPLIFHEEDRQAYYDALRCYDENEELDMLVEFLQQQTAKTWAKALALAEGRKEERCGLEELLGL